MKANALVSVVIPCYKQAHYLGEAIESVLAQTYSYHEVIVVDDGSPDNTSEVASRYPRVRCIKQVNQGLSAARNRGLGESKGECVVFLDADDRLLPEALEIGRSALGAEHAFASGHCKEISSDGSSVLTRKQPDIKDNHYANLLRNCYIWCPATVIYRRDVFDKVRAFNTSINPVADYDLCLRIAQVFPVKCHGITVAEYRHHSGGMSENSALMLSTVLKVLRSQQEFIKGDKELESAYKTGIEYYKNIYGEKLVGKVRAHVRKHRWKDAAKVTQVLLEHDPGAVVTHASRKLYCLLFQVRDQS